MPSSTESSPPDTPETRDPSSNPTHLNSAHIITTSAQDARLPVEHWDSDMLVRQVLRRLPEPLSIRPINNDAVRARIKLFTLRVRDLERMKDSLPRYSYQVELEIAAARFKRKLCLWSIFPINNLPEEILVHIFRLVVHLSDSPSQATDHRLHLTWVCRHWREVAINDKVLWSCVWFRDRPPYARSLAWVQRAGHAPLDIRVDEMQPTHPGETRDKLPRLTEVQVAELMDAIMPKIATIRSLVVVLDTWEGALMVLHKLGTAAVPLILERLEVHRAGLPYQWVRPGKDPVEARIPVTLLNGVAPRLKWLTVNGLNMDWHHSPLSNLHTLDFRRMAMDACPTSIRWREILRGCPRLYKLHLDASGPRWEETPSREGPLRLTYLRDLCLGDLSVRYSKYVLSQIAAPDLVVLCFMNMNGEDFGPLLEHITGHFPKVQVLSMYSFNVNDIPENWRRMVRWLESMPHVRVLKVAQLFVPILLKAFLENPRKYRAEEDEGAPEAIHEVLCPSLSAFQFSFQEFSMVRALLDGRKQLDVPLENVYTHRQDKRDTEIPTLAQVEEIKALISGQMVDNHNMLFPAEEREVHRAQARFTEFPLHLMFQDYSVYL
ncbi:hypothetical protein C8Q75DRAFT_343131 [Abortiporus biennis]|nr:hypothetical protein C8Q75DRAFT_343131 [Abortiporus biennis]